MNPEPFLPLLHQGDLDESQLDDYVADLLGCAEILAVRHKGRSAGHCEDSGPNALTTAVARLQVGGVRGIQVEYVFRRQLWVDTLLRVPSGIRCIRMQMPRTGD
jgi:hypothetical protein